MIKQIITGFLKKSFLSFVLKFIFKIKLFCLLILLVSLTNYCFSQFSLSDSTTINKSRLNGVIISESVLFAGTMAGLYSLWYKDYPMNGFHLLNDNAEWLQIDKAGHATTSYYIGKIGYEALKWSGVKENKAIWYGGLYGSVYLLTIEILDGFSAEWGFSLGDFTANTFGSALFISQQLAWHEQRIMLKYSTHFTDYAQYRPNLMGNNWPQRIIKDYNGCTYWLSGNIHSFLPKNSGFPKWLNIAIGYGAEGMIGANSNPAVFDGKKMPTFERYRQFYLSLDIDLTRIPTKSKTLDLLFDLIGFIKIPLPTLEYNTHEGFRGHAIYF